MYGRQAKETTSVPLDPALRDLVQRLADSETEGNRSQMIRKLIREALDARQAREDGKNS